jgi:hypothetical protein
LEWACEPALAGIGAGRTERIALKTMGLDRDLHRAHEIDGADPKLQRRGTIGTTEA